MPKRFFRLGVGIAVLCVILVIVVWECRGANSPLLRVVSEEPQLISYAEAFNAAHPRLHVEFTYVPHIDVAQDQLSREYDLLFSRNLTPRDGARYFYPLNFLSIQRSDFFEGLLATGRAGSIQRLLPLSFNVPIIVFNRQEIAAEQMENRLTIQLPELQELAAQHNVLADNNYSRMGFSPRWESDFLYLLTTMYGAAYSENRRREPQWNEDQLFQALNYARNWIELTNGGLAREDEFKRRYIHPPHYKLLIEGSVGFVYMDLASFYEIELSAQRLLDYRILRGPEGIPILEDLLYGGILKRADNLRRAEQFMRWLFDSEHQIDLLRRASEQRTALFGIAGGLSTLREVTQIHLPRYYPSLLGRIPPEELLLSTPYPAHNWRAIREEVVERWLLNNLHNVEQRSLAREVELWILKQE